MNKHAFTTYLNEIKSFFGTEWFQLECDRAGEIPDPRKTHPMIYYWIQTDNYINNKKSHPGLNLVPKYEMLSVFELAQYIRIVVKAKVCDLSGNVLDLIVQDLFQHRLRTASQAHYYSALYEMQIASLYLRKGYLVRFIHDTEKHPEFVVTINGEDIYVECKRIDKRVIDRADENTLTQLYNRIEELLIAKNLGVLVVCDGEISNEDNWMFKKITGLIDVGVSPQVEQIDDYSFKIFSASLRSPVSSDSTSDLVYGHLIPFLEKQVQESFSGPMTIIPVQFAGKLVTEPSGSRHSELQGCLAVALRETPNRISGIKKMINKAYTQLPKQGIGIVYVACPPYAASEEETNQFWRNIENELNSITRIYSVVITGVVEEDNSFSHISTVKVNNKCSKPLPHDLRVLPLLDKFALKFEKAGTH